MGIFTINSNITGSNDLIIERDFRLGSNAYIGSNMTISNDLIVLQNQYNMGTYVINSNITGSNNLIIERDFRLGSNAFIGSNMTVSNVLYVNRNQETYGTLLVNSNITCCNNVYIQRELGVDWTATFHSNIVGEKPMFIRDSAVFNSNITSCNNVFIQRELTVNSNVVMHSNLIIDNDIEVKNLARVRNSMILTGGAYLDRCDITSNLTVNTNTIVHGSMSVSGNFYNARIGLGYMGNYLSSNMGPDIVQAQNYNDNSDLRIKRDVRDVEDPLEIVRKIKIKKFKYNYGHEKLDNIDVYGCIAQEVEVIDPGLVYQTKGYLPDIQKLATCISNKLIFESPIFLTIGTNIKLIKNGVEMVTCISRVVDEKSCDVTSQLNDGIYFVYGKETDELKNVDYKQLFVLALGAISKLSNGLV